MKTKTIITVCLVAFILASCVPATKITPTETAFPTSTFTPNPTKTLKPTEALTATATKDPNEPAGATGYDEKGYYKEADGVKYYVTEFVDAKGEIIWVSDHIKNPTFNGGIPLIDLPAVKFDPLISFTLDVKEGIEAPYITHIQDTKSTASLIFSRVFYTTLLDRYFERKLSDSYQQLWKDQYTQLWKDLYDPTSPNYGKISILVTDESGETFSLPINNKTTIRVVIVQPEDIDGGFETILNSSKIKFKDGDLTILVASKKPIESLSKREFADRILSSMLRIFSYQDQSIESFKNNRSLNARIDELCNLAINGEYPLFVIEP